MLKKIIALVAAISVAATAYAECIPARTSEGRIKRNSAQVAKFRRVNPCPSTGAPHGPCPGYVVDHIQPLCACGPDQAENMQWQTIAEAREKDKAERRMCGVR